MALNANLADDDLNSLAKSSLNQNQNVIPSGSGVATSVSSRGNATGTVASPGKAGFGGADRPGRRLYNPLSKLASYTYNLTLYMITPDAYSEFVASGRQNIKALQTINEDGSGAGAYIIAQSGGINNSTDRRAPGFEVDYYIDNLKYNTVIGSAGTGTDVSCIPSLSFQITEPYGFSFLTKLKRAADALKAYTDNTAYKELSDQFKQIYILGIRFYGYDIDGRIVQSGDSLYGEPIDPLGSGALFEQFYDIQFTNVRFKLDGKATVYNVEATGINAQSLLGVKRGRVPTGVKVQGRTVDDVLQGPEGLITKLNKLEQDKVNKKPPDAKVPNIYSIMYQGDAYERIGLASIVTQSDLDKWRWPGSGAKTTSESTDAKSNKPPDPNERMFTFNNDESIVQMIETIIKKSQYMEQSLQTVYSNAKQPDPTKKGYVQSSVEDPFPLAWFSINSDITACYWDDKIKDWAYEQTFVITVYDIPSVATPFAPDTTKYYGPHKRYDYYFTGQNSEVLDYTLTFDNLYFNTVLGMTQEEFKPIGTTENPGAEREGQGSDANAQGTSGSATGNSKATAGNSGTKSDPPPPGSKDTSAGTAVAGGASVRTGATNNTSKMGGLGISLEAQNSVVTSLQDDGAYCNGRIRILGDPDFLMRDAQTSLTQFYSKFYGTDGYTISASGGQVYIEVAFKEAVDYNNETGVMDINESILFLNYPQYIKDMAQGAVIWMLTEVESTFSQGKFEQTLTLVGPTFDMGEPGSDDSTTKQTQEKQGSNDDDLKTDVGEDKLSDDPFAEDDPDRRG